MVAIECDPDPTTGLTCCWPIDTANCCPTDGDESEEHTALVERMAAVASAMMSRLSGYRIGQCATVLRPLDNCGDCRQSCCGGADGIMLSGPNGLWVDSVTAVTMGDEDVDPTTYRFDRETQMLWRVPDQSWPTIDTRFADCGTPDAFCVDVLVGSAPDAWALQVASTLTCELVNSCGTGKCRIPRNATSVTGQGVTVTLSDQEIKTLLPEVSGWVQVVNPHNLTVPPRVYSPDLAAARRGTGRSVPSSGGDTAPTIDGGWA